MARFFIDRPIFAWVIAIVIMLAGALSILELPISQYPRSRRRGRHQRPLPRCLGQGGRRLGHPGHRAKLTGLDGLLYMNSTSDSFGNATVTLTFDAGTDPDIAQVQVQNKVQAALTCCRKPSRIRA